MQNGQNWHLYKIVERGLFYRAKFNDKSNRTCTQGCRKNVCRQIISNLNVQTSFETKKPIMRINWKKYIKLKTSHCSLTFEKDWKTIYHTPLQFSIVELYYNSLLEVEIRRDILKRHLTKVANVVLFARAHSIIEFCITCCYAS